MTDEFKTIATTSEGYYTEKRSKFLAFAHHVETVDEIKDLLAGYRKKYYDARHVCYAYMLGAERKDFRANDDGEPSSTAGKPILGQINSHGLTDILIVVVRYYGGVNLGTSGLIVAYREAAADALSHSTIETRQVVCLPSDERGHACRQGDVATHRFPAVRQHLRDCVVHQKKRGRPAS